MQKPYPLLKRTVPRVTLRTNRNPLVLQLGKSGVPTPPEDPQSKRR